MLSDVARAASLVVGDVARAVSLAVGDMAVNSGRFVEKWHGRQWVTWGKSSAHIPR